MVRSLVAAAAMAGLIPNFSAPAPADAQTGPRASVWVEDERDYFSRGDRMQVRFTSSYDAYVAVVHIDTDGTLDFLYPASPWDDGYLRGGRVYSVPQGQYSSWSVRSRPGIGYLYIVASDQPLDFRYFGGPYAGSWDWSFAGRNVRGDPYLALEQITRMLVPDWQYGGYTTDYYSYHVDRRHQYPSYACASSGWGGVRGWGWTPRYGSCDGLVVFLREYPGYYDARRYRGDRHVYLRGDPLPEVRHGYKAPAREPARGRSLMPSPRGSAGRATPAAPSRPNAEQPSRRRPTLERRGGDPVTPAATPRTRGSGGGGSAQPAATPRSRGSGGSAQPAATPRSRGSGGSAQPAATPRSRGSGGSAQPAATPRSRGSGGSAQPAATPRSRGSGGSAQPAATPRSRGSGGSAQPAATPRSRGSGGGGSARPVTPATSRGSGGGSARPATEPSTRRSRGGGGGDYLQPHHDPAAEAS